MSSPRRREQAGGMQPAGLVERALRGAQQVGQREDDRARHDRTVRQRLARSATSSIDALPQIPHDAVATKWRSATVESSNGRDRRTTIVSSGWLSEPGSPPAVPSTSWPVEEALGPQEPDRELGLVARRAHRDRDRDRVLARAGGPDLERRLADDPVVADLERRRRGRRRSGGSSRGGSGGCGRRSGRASSSPPAARTEAPSSASPAVWPHRAPRRAPAARPARRRPRSSR